MKHRNIIIYLIAFSLALTTCKKDYPDNIPQWVKDEITHCKRTHDCCKAGQTLRIVEYQNKNNGNILYGFEYTGLGCTLYDNSKNIICYGAFSCPAIYLNPIKSLRTVWQEDPHKSQYK